MCPDQINKEIHEVTFDWYDSNTFVYDPSGQLIEAGTVLKLSQNIIFLKPLTKEQLLEFKNIVNLALDHELAKR